MSTRFTEPLHEMFSRSRLLILDFKKANKKPSTVSIKSFFDACEIAGINPRLPENRQRFNDTLLEETGSRYLISLHGEDRSAMLEGSKIYQEGRTLHLGMDIFSKDLEAVFAPCDGEIVRVGNEPENHSFGHYLIIKPADPKLPYLFFGHLNSHEIPLGPVTAGQQIAQLGDFINHENGGWSRHLHLQLLSELPKKGAPYGYSSQANMMSHGALYPDPIAYFPDLKLQS